MSDDHGALPEETRQTLELEYGSLWAYYMKTLDERTKIFEMYFRIITLPLVLSGAAAVFLRTAPANSEIIQLAISATFGVLGMFFLLCFASGLASYTYYALESANSRLYLLALRSIRNTWRIRDERLSKAIVIDDLRPNIGRVGDAIIYARGAVFILFNTAVGVSGLSFAILFVFLEEGYRPGPWQLIGYLAASSTVSVLAHILAGYFPLRNYGKSDQVAELRRELSKTSEFLYNTNRRDNEVQE
ncbi:MAG: hypothetical protein AAF641_14740 [Pseudomonadota bacterium]